MSRGTLQWVNTAKGIGIILVVYGHVARGLDSAGINFLFFATTDALIYSFHMPLFFFLSGLFFEQSLSKRSLHQFISNKVGVLLWPYLIWSSIQGLTEVGLSHYLNGNAELADLITLLWQPRAQFWFIYVLFFIVSCSALAKSTHRYVWYALLGFTTLAYFYHDTIIPIWIFNYLAINYIFFNTGIITKARIGQVSKLANPIQFCSFTLVFIIASYLVLTNSYTQISMSSLRLIAALSGIALTIGISLRCSGKLESVLSYLGRYSLEIYLLHILFGSGSRVVLKHVLGIGAAAPQLIIGCIIGLIGPLIVCEIARRLNLGFLFRQIRRQHQPRASL